MYYKDTVNLCTFVGNLGKNPEKRTTNAGKTVAKASIAVNEKYGDTEILTWVNLVMWGQTAEMAISSLHKGSRVRVWGKLRNTQYTDKQGVARTWTELSVESFEILAKGDGKSSSVTDFTSELGDVDFDIDDDEDIPF